MSKKLFVSGLDWSISEEALQEAFEKYGEVVDSVIIKHRDSNRSRGFGFITFDNEEDAENALKAMNNTRLASRKIRVKVAQRKRTVQTRKDRNVDVAYRVRSPSP